MTHLIIVGATGYAGSHIAREAAARGHHVTGLSRTAPTTPIPEVTYRTADVNTDDALTALLDEADVIVHALAPRGELDGKLGHVIDQLAHRIQGTDMRLGVVGGAGSLLTAPDGPLVMDTPDFPEQFRAEAAQMGEILTQLRATDPAVDWFYLSPAGSFGPWAEGTHTGSFRLGGDVILVDADGNSAISGADYAHAFVDEIERPTHRRERFTVAY